MNGVITDTKKGLKEFLQERLDYFINEERNPFVECQMVSYINNGLNKLNDIGTDETVISMFDNNNVLDFRVEE